MVITTSRTYVFLPAVALLCICNIVSIDFVLHTSSGLSVFLYFRFMPCSMNAIVSLCPILPYTLESNRTLVVVFGAPYERIFCTDFRAMSTPRTHC